MEMNSTCVRKYILEVLNARHIWYTAFEVIYTVRCRRSIICYSTPNSAPSRVTVTDTQITANCGRNRSSQLLAALSPLFSALLSLRMSPVRGSHACLCKESYVYMLNTYIVRGCHMVNYIKRLWLSIRLSCYLTSCPTHTCHNIVLTNIIVI